MKEYAKILQSNENHDIIKHSFERKVNAMHEGHRQRMLDKLVADSVLQDHELLEILLFYAIPRKNTNETAHSLIDACGSLAGVFKADVKRLESVEGVGKSTASFLKTVGAIYGRMGTSGLHETPHMVFSYRDFSEYIKERFDGIKEEVLELFALDAKNKITFIQSFSGGDKNHAEIASTDLSRFIADHKPRGIVIVHNHPGASSQPSVRDHDFTRLSHILCTLNNVLLVDHIVVGEDGMHSYYLTGELDQIRKCYDIETMMRHAREGV